MHEYTIKDIYFSREEYISVKVALNLVDEHKVVLKFMNGFVKGFSNRDQTEDEVKDELKKVLLANDKLLLIRLVRIALGQEAIKKQLRAKENGVFEINHTKWDKVLSNIKEEKEKLAKDRLELLLAEGLSEL